jgi:molybdopterin synthase sulfur carrier subunit
LAKVVFTSHLREVAPRRVLEVDGKTVGAVLEKIWAEHPLLQSYVVDEHGRLRRHIAVFLDGRLLKSALRTRVRPDSEVYVMQALSGG